MKPLPLWSLSKLPKTGVYALSSPSRTTCLLVSKKSDSRIAYNPREKEETLSLENEIQDLLHLFFFFLSTFPFGFCFIPSLISFPICFSFFSHFSFFFSSFLPIFSFLFDFLSSFLNHYTYETKMRKFPPHLPQAKHVALPFSSFSFIS